MRQTVVGVLPLFSVTSIMVFAPPVSDHMLRLPRSLRLPPAPGRSLLVRCLAKTSDFTSPSRLITRRFAVLSVQLAHTAVNTDVHVNMHTQHCLHLQQDLPDSGARAFNYGDVNKYAAPLLTELSPGACFLTGSRTQICLRGSTLH